MITVAAIATRWGFCSLSRFIRLYHQHYHTLPGYAART
jgi:transcriptional regulator GlxA family with amidase domain